MLNSISKNITYTDTTAITVGNIPPNSIIVFIKVSVGTAFDAGSTDYIDIGNATTAAAYADNVNVASTGQATVTQTGVGAVLSATSSTPIKAVYVPSGTAPTAGSGYVTIVYDQL